MVNSRITRNPFQTLFADQDSRQLKILFSLSLLEKGLGRLDKSIGILSQGFSTEPEVCQTIQVENVHAVSHLYPTCTLLEYVRYFGTSMKESLKRATKWSAHYFTHSNSYYMVNRQRYPKDKASSRTRVMTTRIPCASGPASIPKPSGSFRFVRTTPSMEQELFIEACKGKSYLLATESPKNPVQLMTSVTSCQSMILTPATMKTTVSVLTGFHCTRLPPIKGLNLKMRQRGTRIVYVFTDCKCQIREIMVKFFNIRNQFSISTDENFSMDWVFLQNSPQTLKNLDSLKLLAFTRPFFGLVTKSFLPRLYKHSRHLNGQCGRPYFFYC